MNGDTMQHHPYVMRECVRRWLDEARRRDMEMRELEYRITELRDRLDGLTSSLGADGIRGTSSDRMADGMARLEQMELDWNTIVREDGDFVANTLYLCPPRMVERYACWLHWFKRETWAQVGRRIGYSEFHARNDIADEGVVQLYPLIPEEFRRYSFPNAEV